MHPKGEARKKYKLKMGLDMVVPCVAMREQQKSQGKSEFSCEHIDKAARASLDGII